MSNNNTTSLTHNSYSQALFELASENNLVNDIEIQVSSILGLIDNSKDFKEVCEMAGYDPGYVWEHIKNSIGKREAHME